jgi:UDP-N-acetylglucosamine 2-epimerase (non-hydrolysing)
MSAGRTATSFHASPRSAGVARIQGQDAMKKTIAIIVGTRPEAVKMAPVYRALEASAHLRGVLISTGQHRELLEATLAPLELHPDHNLEVMSPGQTLNQVVVRVIDRLAPLLTTLAPAAVLVQGDTTTVLAAALAAYHLGIPVGHVEAGLRTYDHTNPFPEEANRQLVDRLATWCFVPTEGSRAHLLAERIEPARIHVTGNTVVDAMVWAAARSRFRCPPNTVLVTLHRRESFGQPLRQILLGVRDFLDAVPEARVLWPLHPNPHVGEAAREVLADHARVQIVSPLDYLDLAGALASCRLVLTDSGGLQEEGPSLGKVVLVAREVTERPEGLAQGRNRLVGRTREGVRTAMEQAWSEPAYTGPIPAPNPYGDGHAGARIAGILEAALLREGEGSCTSST